MKSVAVDMFIPQKHKHYLLQNIIHCSPPPSEMPKGRINISVHRKDGICNSQLLWPLSSSNVKAVLHFRLNIYFFFHDFPRVTELKEMRGRRQFVAVSWCLLQRNNFRIFPSPVNIWKACHASFIRNIVFAFFKTSWHPNFWEISFGLCHKVEVRCNSKCKFIWHSNILR